MCVVNQLVWLFIMTIIKAIDIHTGLQRRFLFNGDANIANYEWKSVAFIACCRLFR